MIFGVIDTRNNICIGSYSGDKISHSAPFDDVINHLHFEVEADRYAEGYYINDSGSLVYNLTYVHPFQTYEALTSEKLVSYNESIKELTLEFAADNSRIMNELGYSTLQKRNAVREVVDVFIDIDRELKMYSYYDVFTMLDNIVRSEPLLTEERITKYKTDLSIILS